MEKELGCLGYQTGFFRYKDELFQIINEVHNQEQIKKGGILSVAIDCFSFGIIIGKKAVRAKHKISNAEVLKRQEKLLLEIENLKLKNEKLKKTIINISHEAEKTIKILTVKETPVKTRVVLTMKKAHTQARNAIV